MHWFFSNRKNAATETVRKTTLGRRRTRDLLLPRHLSGQVKLSAVEVSA
jgi:hypothetical protein